MRFFASFPFQPQHDQMDCGPACIKMVAKYYGKDYSLEYLRSITYLGKEGVSLLSIHEAAEKIGFRSLMVRLGIRKLKQDCPLPCLLHWEQDHFILLNKIQTRFGKTTYHIADPAHGLVSLNEEAFRDGWISSGEGHGTVLLLEPTAAFYSNEDLPDKPMGYRFLFRYLIPYRKNIAWLFAGMIAASGISLIFPFLTQLLIDVGVGNRSIAIIYLILASQLFLFAGDTVIEIVRSWLLLHINTRVSLNIISDFLIKLLRLPIRYFDTKSVGDLSQRINDHHRIESFLTGSALSSFFSLINIIIFSVVLCLYNLQIFIIFVLLSIMGVTWVLLFQNKRKQLDYKRFSRNRENQNKLFEMITGMQEIKLYGSETSKRWEWEQLQVKFFKLNIKSLRLEQYQQTGFVFLTHLKNILISFIAASEAVKGNMTLGTLLSISYIIGQTNSPIDQVVRFIKNAQDARLSLERLQEIHQKDDEEKDTSPVLHNPNLLHESIHFEELSFQYDGPHSPFVLKNLNFSIPKGKITAIVGTSGSGKTTLMKLLLGFYPPTAGRILIGQTDLSHLSAHQWRSTCGTVMQDGFIFYDTITKNIALDGKPLNTAALENAVKTANLDDFIKGLPLGYTTKIGASGIGLSGGQKQRILIARAVYKNPEFLLFDEATSALDASNEKTILENLNLFVRNKTVLVIAHRLSTVKNADQIIVLDKGKLAELGNHSTLIEKKGIYFELVKNQLELGES